MKPFLLLAIRADDAAADSEYESFLAFAGLGERDLRRVRLEQRPLGNIDLAEWSGIFLGGGPFNFSDPEGSKSPVQGHKEAVSALPGHAVLLATSPACPVQAFRIGLRAYATQFHPELDAAGLCTRIEVYKHAGYFEPEQAGALKALAHRSNVIHPPAILRRFAQRYARSGPAYPVQAPDGSSVEQLDGDEPDGRVAGVLEIVDHRLGR